MNSTIKSLLSDLAGIAFEQFNNSLSQAPKNLHDCYSWTSIQLDTTLLERKIAFLIYNCGKIVAKKIDTPSWSASHLEVLSTLLTCEGIQSGKSITNFLYGLGLLADKKRINGFGLWITARC